jgi:autotransporter-associated beta strand protein
VLFNPTTPGTYQYQLATSVVIPSVSLEPGVAGVTLNANNGFNTTGILLSGGNDLAITGTNLFSNTSSSGARTLIVLNPSTTLSMSAAIGLPASGSVNIENIIGGQGFVVFTGTTNQLPSSTSAVTILKLNGGVLRGTATNLNWAAGMGTELDFRGGVLEYDVSGGSATFNRSLSSVQVSWTAADGAGSGGFSAYAGPGNGNGNTLTVNMPNNFNPFSLGSQIRDEYALKFGSTKSNATVIWQNSLDLGAPTTYRARQIDVTLGVGNAADKTQLTALIQGGANADLLKSRTGVLELTANNTYAGNTLVQGGTLRVIGQTGTNSGTGTGSVFVYNGATLGGTGRVAGAVTVLPGGTLAPGASPGILTVAGAVTFSSGSAFAVALNGPTPGNGANNYGQLNLTGGGSANLGGATLLTNLGYAPSAADSLSIITGGPITGTFINAPNNTPFPIGSFGGTTYTATITYGATAMVVSNFQPVPEPAHLLALAAAGLGVACFVRRRRAGRVT